MADNPTQYETVVDLVAALLQGIPKIGMVYSRLRYAKDERDFLALLKTTVDGVDQLRAWMITSRAQLYRRGPSISVLEDIPLTILGYMSSNDAMATERTFNALTEIVADTLASHIHAGQVGGTTPVYVAEASLPNIRTRTYAKIGGVLCHYAELDYKIVIHKEITYVD